jgi:flavorubredoxin
MRGAGGAPARCSAGNLGVDGERYERRLILNPFAPILTKKLAEITGFNLIFDMIAPSHGAIWRENPLQIVEKSHRREHPLPVESRRS